MAFPEELTNWVDGETEIFAIHFNSIEAKIGIDDSPDTTSLDYLLKNPGSIDPGHKHTIFEGISGLTVSAEELNYVAGVTSSVQAQLNGKINHSLATAANDFLVASGAGVFVKKTLAETQAILGLGSAAYTDSSIYSLLAGRAGGQTITGGIGAGENLTLQSTSHATKGALLLAQNGGNVGIGSSIFGDSASKVFMVGSGTAPTTSPGDCFQMYSKDITAGNAAPHFRTEAGNEIRLYQQAHLADPTADVSSLAYWAAEINSRLENLGLNAAS